MEERYDLFVERIHGYCREHTGEKVLFPLFMNLWPELEISIEKKELAVYTSKAVNKLVSEKMLKEVPKERGFDNVYGLYEILRY